MKNLVKIISSIVLIIAITGCTGLSSLNSPEKAKIDNTLEAVNSQSVRSISSITSVAFEWQKVDDTRIIGYNLYRAEPGSKDSNKLTLVKFIKNRYTTHYVDQKLEPNTRYNYAISSVADNDIESLPTEPVQVQTLPTLEAISFVQAISNLPRQIKILWRPHSNERVARYLIQRKTPYDNSWDDLTYVDGRLNIEYIDDHLKDNIVYMYRVYAVGFDNIKSKVSEVVRAQTKPLPEGPGRVSATYDLPKKIQLAWDPTNTADVIRYKIYRSNSINGSYSALKVVTAAQLNYEDLINDDGVARFYKVVSLDKDGLESSLETNGIMGTTLAKLSKPVITLAQIQGQRAIINWQPGDKRAQYYIVYKTQKQNFFSSKTLKYGNVEGLRFEDQDIVRGVEYSYAIQAVDEYGITSEKTETTTIVLPKLSGEK